MQCWSIYSMGAHFTFTPTFLRSFLSQLNPRYANSLESLSVILIIFGFVVLFGFTQVEANQINETLYISEGLWVWIVIFPMFQYKNNLLSRSRGIARSNTCYLKCALTFPQDGRTHPLLFSAKTFWNGPLAGYLGRVEYSTGQHDCQCNCCFSFIWVLLILPPNYTASGLQVCAPTKFFD